MKNGTAKKACVVKTPELPDAHGQIELRAYELWIAGGSRHGQALSHWLQAEREIGTTRVQKNTR